MLKDTKEAIWLKLTVSAYITLAPPPATIVQMRPFGFKMVNFKEALVCKFKEAIYLTSILHAISRDSSTKHGNKNFPSNIKKWKNKGKQIASENPTLRPFRC